MRKKETVNRHSFWMVDFQIKTCMIFNCPLFTNSLLWASHWPSQCFKQVNIALQSQDVFQEFGMAAFSFFNMSGT